MKKVGQVLKEARLKKGLSLAQVEVETKIRQKIIEALEEGAYNRLPAPPFVKGLIKNYGEFLSLPPSSLLALYRREVKGYQSSAYQNKQSNFLGFGKRIHLTPNIALFTLTFVVLIVIIFYITSQYLSLAAVPRLEITSPSQNQIVTTEVISISGKTDPGTSIIINNEEIRVSPSGDFKIDYLLADGSNRIEIISVSKAGKENKIIRTVEKISSP